MSDLLLDTNIVSFILKQDTRAKLYVPTLQGKLSAVSFMTVAELYQWANIRKWGKSKRNSLEKNLNNYTLLPFTVRLCQRWADVRGYAYDIGRAIDSDDAWIAATALHYQLSLVTHNPKDFDFVPNLTIISFA